VPGWTGLYLTNVGSSDGGTTPGIYQDFYDWLKARPELLTNITAYNNDIAAYGQTIMFVVDEVPGSVRFPKITRAIHSVRNPDGSDAGIYNDQIQNITASWQMLNQSGAARAPVMDQGSGAIFTDDGNAVTPPANAATLTASYGGVHKQSFDASRVARTGTETFSAHARLFPWIYVYNTAVPASSSENAAFLQEVINLNNKLANKETVSNNNLGTVGVTYYLKGNTNAPLTLPAGGAWFVMDFCSVNDADGTLKRVNAHWPLFQGNNTMVFAGGTQIGNAPGTGLTLSAVIKRIG